MSPGLLPDASPNDRFEILNRRPLSKGLQQVDFFIPQQAQAQYTISSQTRTGAACAKWLRHAADQPNCSLRTRNPVQASFAVKFTIVQEFQRAVYLFNSLADFHVGD